MAESNVPEQGLPAAFAPGCSAVITGAAGGIGLATARALAARGMNVLIADLAGDALSAAEASVREAAKGGMVIASACDVSKRDQVEALAAQAADAFGHVDVLMNNAGIGPNPGKTWEGGEGWEGLMAVNLWGVIHGVQAFVPAMVASGRPGVVINSGSKQGITLPPGNGAYNVSKAALKAYTETLSYELSQEGGGAITAHLLIPGFVFTGLTARGRAEKPAGAWTAEQTVAFMMQSLARGDFYILCPDNDVDRATDERRVAWMAGDLIENRPALSRWRPEYAEAFARFMGK